MATSATIGDIAQFIRSKNAGPFWITIDVFCGSKEKYQLICQSKSLTPEAVAKVYNVSAKDVRIFQVANVNVVKISYPRIPPQGSIYERDMHAGQQYIELEKLPV